MTKTPERRDKGMDRERGQNPNDPQRNRERKPMGDQDDDDKLGGGERGGERGGGGDRGRKGGSER